MGGGKPQRRDLIEKLARALSVSMSASAPAPKSAAERKAERLAQALRANLRRRKAADRATAEKPSPDDAAPFRDQGEPG